MKLKELMVVVEGCRDRLGVPIEGEWLESEKEPWVRFSCFSKKTGVVLISFIFHQNATNHFFLKFVSISSGMDTSAKVSLEFEDFEYSIFEPTEEELWLLGKSGGCDSYLAAAEIMKTHDIKSIILL